MNKPTDYTKLLKGHKDEWVGISNDKNEVVAAADTPQKVIKQARDSGYEDVSVLWATDDYGGFISGT